MFCDVCGEFTVKSQRHSLRPLVKKANELYFGCKIEDQDKSWARRICCGACARKLRKWLQGSRPSMSLQYRWHGVSKRLTSEIFISVSPIYKASLQNPSILFNARICPRLYGQSIMTVSPFQSPQVTGPLMMKLRRTSGTTGMELQPIQLVRIQIYIHQRQRHLISSHNKSLIILLRT